MGFKEWWETKKEEREEKARLEQLEKEKREAEFNQFQEILDKFEVPKLKEFCKDFLGIEPTNEFEDEKTGKKIMIALDRKSYIDFIIDYYKNKKQLKLSQLRDYAINHKILPPAYGTDSSNQAERREFENIIENIRTYFQPEDIKDEEHLEAQLTVFLKAKFPDKKVERQVGTISGGRPDIVVDNKYALELKVPKQRADLRDLTGQLEEYAEEYSYLCAIIANTSESGSDITIVDQKIAEMSQIIKEYVDRYRAKLSVPSLVFDVKKRG